MKIGLAFTKPQSLAGAGICGTEISVIAMTEQGQKVPSVSAAIANGIQLPANFAWRTIDNQNIPMTPQEVAGFGVAMMDWLSRVYAVSWFHRDTLDTLMDIQDIASYDITVGWPSS